ncbi:MAG: formyltetrahydrofolate deformylase [Betaproteobacteria bacterium]|nr:formyltetrahydrofolate deformylase [Betaproteobacteria bacterium]MBK7592457.1 formyltetrahydrofolate deformylase [Betaproteobacteria bacterium]MBK7743126.1 formyltetrahydrofolate deformylase [Betaproteobacteria bacterium]MBL0290649.1 formyltetrahydrofolate deformylase [Betaproteobacteria bacterium]
MRYILTLSCTDRPGIVAAVATFLAGEGCNILESAQFDDVDTGRFFMRVVCAPVVDGVTLDRIATAFGPVAAGFGMDWQLRDAAQRLRVLIMVSKQDHCLNDLLYRYKVGALHMEPVAIVSNHRDSYQLAASYDIPFHHLPVTAATKPAQEAKLWALCEEYGVDLVVLARYMQVLSDDLARKLEGRAINIHHGLLPSFKGAKPYHQAHARGVKLIGATAHYVTSVLDEGPIIEQEVARVEYNMRAEDLVALGRDVECQALARAVRGHLEHRVFLNGQKTVVFR